MVELLLVPNAELSGVLIMRPVGGGAGLWEPSLERLVSAARVSARCGFIVR